MIEKKHRLRQIPDRKTLEAIATGLDDITDFFKNEGLSVQNSDSLNEPQEDSDNDEASGPPKAFDREDIEVAIDQFISHLIQENIVKNGRSVKPMSFSEVFETFFGEDADISEKARDFEESIEGYFDLVPYDKMEEASKEVLEIQDMVQKLIKDESHAKS